VAATGNAREAGTKRTPANRGNEERLLRASRSGPALKSRPLDDERLDGGARELGKHERRGVDRRVVIAKRFERGALCRASGVVVEEAVSESANAKERKSLLQEFLKKNVILRSLRRNKNRQRTSDILKL
jgi:hypothetical protein